MEFPPWPHLYPTKLFTIESLKGDSNPATLSLMDPSHRPMNRYLSNNNNNIKVVSKQTNLNALQWGFEYQTSSVFQWSTTQVYHLFQEPVEQILGIFQQDIILGYDKSTTLVVVPSILLGLL